MLFEDACIREQGNLELRFSMSLRWTHLALNHKHTSVLHAFTTALELLDTLVTMSSSLKQRHSRVVGKENSGQVQRLASDAAAVALNAQQPRRAVELLEQGRGVLLAQLVRYRTSLDDLQAVSPSLAARFKDLSSQLEQSVNADGAGNLSSMKSPSDRVGRYVTFSHILMRISAPLSPYISA